MRSRRAEEEGVPKWGDKRLEQLNFLFKYYGGALKEAEAALYYRALTELIVNFVRVTASEIPAEASLAAAPHEATHATHASVRSQLSVLPAPLRAGVAMGWPP